MSIDALMNIDTITTVLSSPVGIVVIFIYLYVKKDKAMETLNQKFIALFEQNISAIDRSTEAANNLNKTISTNLDVTETIINALTKKGK